MQIQIADRHSLLARRAQARSWEHGRGVEAVKVDDRPTSYFAGDEVLADAADTDLVRLLEAQGGRIVRHATDPEMPAEFRQLGLGREHEIDMTGLPRTVKIRFEEIPRTDVRLERVLDREDGVGSLTFSSERSQALAALVAPLRAEGRGVSLNAIGRPAALPVKDPAEGAGLAFAASPLAWPSMTGRARIAEAWQLVETMRRVRSVHSPVFVAICDTGFWSDPAQPPGSPGAQTRADIGAGMVRWNAADDAPGIPGGPGFTSWHGTMVASAAAAVVGNSVGAAGSGGTVAIPCFFHNDHSSDSALTTMIRCAQWGIPIVNFSWQFTTTELFFGTSHWNDTFNWAADNGVLAIAAAGNDNQDLPDDDNPRPATRTPRVLTVGALAPDDTRADFSNHGSSVGLYAPGVGIPVAPTPTNAGTLMGSSVDGTSFAAPIVAGVAAMVRAVNPALSPDDIRDTIVRTAWNGPAGRSLDAYAAVWDAMQQAMTESVTEAREERLFLRGDGTFSPIFNDGVNRAYDTDAFLLDVRAFSTIRVDVEWYDRLSRVRLELENIDPAAPPTGASSTSAGAGLSTLTATVGSGTYRLKLVGSGPTAYTLNGRVTPGVIGPDIFEFNDSFDTATRLRVQPRGAFEIVALFDREHGPGGYELTLHTAAAGPATTDRDFFAIDVPAMVGALSIPTVQITHSDEPVEVVLYDAARQPIVTFPPRRVHAVHLPLGGRSYVSVSGPTHTRYGLAVGVTLDGAELRRRWQEVRLLPDWWQDNHPDWVVEHEELRALVVNPETVADGVLTFGGADGGPLQHGVRLELLDDAGHRVREGESRAGRTVFDVADLEPGAYVVRAHVDGRMTRDAGARLNVVALQAPAEVTRG